MRSAALAAVCLACLALSCRMDCDLGTSGVGCQSEGGGHIGCRTDADCAPGSFCDLVLERCPKMDAGAVEVKRIQSSSCKPAPTDTRGTACTSSDECAPDETCASAVCGPVEACWEVLACRAGCVLTREPHTSCSVCVCDC